MFGALPISVITLAMTYIMTADPGFRLNGVIAAQAFSQVATILWNLGILALWRRDRLRPHAR